MKPGCPPAALPLLPLRGSPRRQCPPAPPLPRGPAGPLPCPAALTRGSLLPLHSVPSGATPRLPQPIPHGPPLRCSLRRRSSREGVSEVWGQHPVCSFPPSVPRGPEGSRRRLAASPPGVAATPAGEVGTGDPLP